MPENKSNLEQFIDDLDQQDVRLLAAAAVQIGYTFGGHIEPPMVTADMAHKHLSKIEGVLQESPLWGTELYLHNYGDQDLVYVNQWRQLMDEKLLDRYGHEQNGDEMCSECGAGFHDDNHASEGMCDYCLEMLEPADETEG